MEIEKGKTIKYIKEKHVVSQTTKDQLKQFNRMKKSILGELKAGRKTIPELADKLGLPANTLMFFLMSLLKYGFVETDEIDDDDEYFYYKIKDNG